MATPHAPTEIDPDSRQVTAALGFAITEMIAAGQLDRDLRAINFAIYKRRAEIKRVNDNRD